MRALLRYLVWVPAAFIVACFAAGLVVALGLYGDGPDGHGGFVELTQVAAINAGIAAFGPMLIAIFATEALRTRSFLFWLAFGGVLGVAAQLGDAVRAEPELTGARAVLLVVAGLAGGAVYWLTAGRYAGLPKTQSVRAEGRPMRSVWRIILVIPAAFIAASLAAAFVITLSAGAQPISGESGGDFVAKLIFISIIASMVVGAVAAIPALIMIIMAETFGWRSLILHLVFGVLIGLAAFLLGIGGATETREAVTLGGAAGAVGGFVYWLIAGRKAGLGQERRVPDGNGDPA